LRFVIFMSLNCQGDVLRNAYHAFIKQSLSNLKTEHPDWSGRDCLKAARALLGT